MRNFRKLDPDVRVAGQIEPEDIAAAAADGVTMIVNNRPDGEEPGQPTSDQMAQAAAAAGIAYRHIPMTGLNGPQVAEMAAALTATEGMTLAFCRSGTRSTYLWALARSSQGVDRDLLIGQATAAGYDLTPVIRFL